MAGGKDWSTLPSVIIVEILSYLSFDDILKSSSVCKSWRSCLFHPNLWHIVFFSLDTKGISRAKFLAENCGRFIREATVKFDSKKSSEVKDCIELLNIFSKNKNLEQFSLRPSNCHILWSEKEGKAAIDKILDHIEEIIKNSRKLKHFSLGCVEELSSHSSSLVQQLVKYHSKNLTSLHLPTVKEDGEHYGIIEFDTTKLLSFKRLSNLSIDYDYLSNELLEGFVDNHRIPLERLHIHIHGIGPEHEFISNTTWRSLKTYCPSLEVTLNLTHTYDGLNALLDVLQPSLPLVHFRQYYCSTVNVAVIEYISTHYVESLRSLTIVDEMTDNEPLVYVRGDEHVPDPFVMLAWRCTKLIEFTIIGWGITDEDIIAISRLRGENLQKFVIPMSCIFSAMSLEEDHDDDNNDDNHSDDLSDHYISQEFFDKVSKSLKRTWWPIEDTDLPLGLFDSNADSEEIYMDTLLDDQISS